MQHLSNSPIIPQEVVVGYSVGRPNKLGVRAAEKAGSPSDRANGFVRCDDCWGPKLPRSACLYCIPKHNPETATMYVMTDARVAEVNSDVAARAQKRAEAAEAELMEFRERCSTKAHIVHTLQQANGSLTAALKIALAKIEQLEMDMVPSIAPSATLRSPPDARTVQDAAVGRVFGMPRSNGMAQMGRMGAPMMPEPIFGEH